MIVFQYQEMFCSTVQYFFFLNVAFLSQLLLDRLLVAMGLLGLLVREEHMQGFLK